MCGSRRASAGYDGALYAAQHHPDKRGKAEEADGEHQLKIQRLRVVSAVVCAHYRIIGIHYGKGLGAEPDTGYAEILYHMTHGVPKIEPVGERRVNVAGARKACEHTCYSRHYARRQEGHGGNGKHEEYRQQLLVSQPNIYKHREDQGYPARAGVGHEKRKSGECKPQEQQNAGQGALSRACERRAQRHEQHEKLRVVIRVIER